MPRSFNMPHKALTAIFFITEKEKDAVCWWSLNKNHISSSALACIFHVWTCSSAEQWVWHEWRWPNWTPNWMGGLAQDVTDFFVYVTKKVHIRWAAIHPFVFNQKMVKPWLQLVALTHNCQLHKKHFTLEMTLYILRIGMQNRWNITFISYKNAFHKGCNHLKLTVT